MELSKNFNHGESDQRWYAHWTSKKYFHSEPDGREPYTVVIPPPNVTGVLHMGHCLNNTIQDILVRRARMLGMNACWVPGTDHASIATEAKVVQMLRERGISKSSISREKFLEYAWEWKEKYGGIILQQLRKLGCSLDWERTHFTMDPEYYRSVIGVFNDLYEKGCIYRGKRMINWDPKAKTALSDEEVIFREVQSRLYYVRYQVADSSDWITIATVRPETILGDTAICVYPDDERYKKLQGKWALVPLINRRIPIIADEYVSMEFGTGALKITPAHDMNDYQLGLKHGLEIIDTLNEDGTLSEEAGLFVGTDRFEARKLIVAELEKTGHLVKVEDYQNQIGFSERTDVVVEPRLSLQWWVSMKKLSAPALDAVMNDDIAFYPSKFRNLYRHWMENIKDWCISRQLWWGHRIPAWYMPDGEAIVAHDAAEALEKARTIDPAIKPEQLSQDEDCLDTWFSSWLWPFEVFGGYSRPGNADVRYYYPTSTLVTAPEIIFFWVARMIMAGFEFQGSKPFNQVYFTGIVRDKQGRKMSKSLGNSPDLLELIDRYGADAVRFGIMIASPAGNDLLWDESSNEQGRNFNNKLWNALRLVKGWSGRLSENKPSAEDEFAAQWFANRMAEARKELDSLFADFKLSEALKVTYSLIWDDFCSWYLEWVKPPQQSSMSAALYERTVLFFEELLQLLHPFMPFITEEIYHELSTRQEGDDLTIRLLSPAKAPDSSLLSAGSMLKDAITSIRDARNKQQIKPRTTIRLSVETGNDTLYKTIAGILTRQVNAESFTIADGPVAGAIAVVLGTDRFYMESEQAVDLSSQRSELEKELAYLKGFLIAVDKKLGNEKFVNNARPEVVELERKKKQDAEEKIRVLEESLQSIG